MSVTLNESVCYDRGTEAFLAHHRLHDPPMPSLQFSQICPTLSFLFHSIAILGSTQEDTSDSEPPKFPSAWGRI